MKPAAILAFSIRLGIGGLLVWGGAAKLDDFSWWRDLVERMDLFPVGLTGPLAAMLPGIELLCGGLLILGVAPRSSALTATLLHILFGVVMSLLVLGDAPATCGCFGPDSEYPVGWNHALLNLAQALAATALLFLPTNMLSLEHALAPARN